MQRLTIEGNEAPAVCGFHDVRNQRIDVMPSGKCKMKQPPMAVTLKRRLRPHAFVCSFIGQIAWFGIDAHQRSDQVLQALIER